MKFETSSPSVDQRPVEDNLALETENEVDTAELANKLLQNEQEVVRLTSLNKKQDEVIYQDTLDSIKAESGAQEKNEAEARRAHRIDFTKRALQMVIDNLQNKIDKKGLAGLLTPKKELAGDINGLKFLQAQERAGFNVEMLFAYPSVGKLADSVVKKEIISMIKSEFDEQDQQVFEGNEQVRNQVGRRMSSISAG